MPDWIQIRVAATDEIKGGLTNFLFELGSCGCQDLGNEICAFFPGQISKTDIQVRLTTYLENLKGIGFEPGKGLLQIMDLANQDWNSEWKKSFKPIRISEKFIIKPTWEKLAPPPEIFIIEMDPKQAFGTGHHETTKLMMAFLEKYLVPQKRVLDVGTGTGILAIAARKLAVGEIVAIDIDPIAIEAAKENCELNAATSRLLLITGEVAALRRAERFDFVLANVNKLVILNSLPAFNQLLNPNGRLILSGILVEEGEQLKRAFLEYSFLTLVEEMSQGEWVGYVLEKRA